MPSSAPVPEIVSKKTSLLPFRWRINSPKYEAAGHQCGFNAWLTLIYRMRVLAEE
jgi:hypothetical protein